MGKILRLGYDGDIEEQDTNIETLDNLNFQKFINNKSQKIKLQANFNFWEDFILLYGTCDGNITKKNKHNIFIPYKNGLIFYEDILIIRTDKDNKILQIDKNIYHNELKQYIDKNFIIPNSTYENLNENIKEYEEKQVNEKKKKLFSLKSYVIDNFIC